MDKIEKDGKVAVLYAADHCGGWSTANDRSVGEVLCMDARIVRAFIEGGTSAAIDTAKALFQGLYVPLSPGKLAIEWVEKCDQFYVEERDGREYVILKRHRTYYTA